MVALTAFVVRARLVDALPRQLEQITHGLTPIFSKILSSRFAASLAA